MFSLFFLLTRRNPTRSPPFRTPPPCLTPTQLRLLGACNFPHPTTGFFLPSQLRPPFSVCGTFPSPSFLTPCIIPESRFALLCADFSAASCTSTSHLHSPRWRALHTRSPRLVSMSITCHRADARAMRMPAECGCLRLCGCPRYADDLCLDCIAPLLPIHTFAGSRCPIQSLQSCVPTFSAVMWPGMGWMATLSSG